MCIIIAKNKSDRLPTIEELKNSFEYNSDGAGFMYVDNGKVIIDKGYMYESDFLKRYSELCDKYNNFKDKCLVVHCRIGTSSSNTAKNTHPYPITYKESELHKTYFECELGMAHNGIIHDYTPKWNKPTTNDTQEFILKYVYPLYDKWSDFYKNKFILKGLKEITGSKLAFLDKDDNLYLVGDFTEDNNLMFSNTSYRHYSYSYSGSSTNTYHYKGSTYTTNIVKEEDKEEDIDDYVKLDNSWEDYSYDYGYYYDIEQEDYDYTKLYLYSGYWVEFSGTCKEVGDDDLFVWDYNTGDLYTIMSDYSLRLIEKNVIVYDENFEEIV